MRIIDLLHPHLDGITTVVDATARRGPRLERYLHLPPGVELSHHEEDIDAGQLVVMSYGPNPNLHGDEAACLAVLERMRPGGRGVILFGHRGTELTYHRLLDHLVTHRCQVLRVSVLGYTHLQAGAVFACTEELLPLHDWFGIPAPSDGFATALRMAGECVFSDFVSRSLRARTLDQECTAEETARALDGARSDGTAEQLAAMTRERAQLASRLRGARDRVALLEARVAMLEASTSLKVGRALVATARSPRREMVRLPGELYRMWRGRGPGMTDRPVPPAREPDAVVSDSRLYLAHRALSSAPRERLVIGGVLSDGTAEDFAAEAVVNRLLPHDGLLLLERTNPDALVVQLSACSDATGPWSLTGTGLVPDLDSNLAQLITQARALGRKAVLWRDAPATGAPGLAHFDWDAVVDTDTGVRLSRLDPVEEGRTGLWEAFQHNSIRVRLAQLARLTGSPNPLDGRRIAVLAAPRTETDVARLTDQVLGQMHRPAEVVVPDQAVPALDELTAAGVAVHAGEPTAPWVADWTDLSVDRPDTLLLDLMCAQEYSGADAVGHTPADDDYAFVPELRPALVRRSLHLADAPADTWSREGYRLFAVRWKEMA
ncbi:hypothetical protein [Streptomyces himalayensis]|uniref:Uncharacterized protein n=1 Tax=Streptomyces himalayensis subsp. himalayensis TaxID=2756131 RepID=A0A7W0DQQ4_9ACTN|nr:hypothetical protein [Streptomyces himalayensis]MBA2949514.1 hypothetical protein [Streptomyces himalayensis subsp. himalayensis]